MTAFLNKYILIVLIACHSSIITKAQEEEDGKGFKIDMILKSADKGEVLVDMKVKYNAFIWDIYKRQTANNPSIIKNSLAREFCKYSLTNFNITNNEMERSYHATFTILGMLHLEEGGKWIADLDTKDPDITKISQTEYLMVDKSSPRSVKIFLPATATDSKIEKDAFGNTFLTYYAPVSTGSGKLLMYGGYLLAATGIFLFFKNRFTKKKQVA